MSDIGIIEWDRPPLPGTVYSVVGDNGERGEWLVAMVHRPTRAGRMIRFRRSDKEYVEMDFTIWNARYAPNVIRRVLPKKRKR